MSDPVPGTTATVRPSDGLRLRGGPSLDAAILETMPQGTEVTLTGGRQNGFVAATHGGQNGWAFSVYLATADHKWVAPVGRVKPSDGLRLRSGPSTDAAILETMPVGTVVALTDGSENGFLAVSRDGRAGWAFAEFLMTPPPDPDPIHVGVLKAIKEILGGEAFHISQSYGPTDFVPDPVTAYDYCDQYGCPPRLTSGIRTHCAADIGVGRGTPLIAPANGRVICAGTGNGLEECAAFRDGLGGAGRVELELGDGTRVIFGHTSECSVAPGQHVSAGQQIAKSGQAGTGAHLHLEVRVPDGSTPSGLRTVDPFAFFHDA